jgi:hypothetical protein
MPTTEGDFYATWAPNKTHYLLKNHDGRWENLSSLPSSASQKGPTQGPTVCFGADRTLWVIEKNRLVQLTHDPFRKSIPSPLPHLDDVVEDCARDRYGQFWISIYGSGLYVFRDDSWRKFEFPAEFKSMHLTQMATDNHGFIIIYFNNGKLIRVDKDNVETILLKKANTNQNHKRNL